MQREPRQPQACFGLRRARKIEDMESEIIRTAIARYDSDMSEVARRLGIGRSTLCRNLKEFGLEETVQGEPPDEERKAG